MSYVPGFENDIFISYCHGDDRPWIRSFYELLRTALKEQLGIEPKVWIDKETLESSIDFRKEIPETVCKSALFLLLPSNQYVRSRYCVDCECAAFESKISDKRARFDSKDFRNHLFALRAPILPVDDNAHWKLFEGLTDYKFHDGRFRLPVSSPEFSEVFGRLVFDIAGLLKRMRNHSTKIFLYPRDPGPGIAVAHTMLKTELLDHGYYVVPDSLIGLETGMLESALAGFLLDEAYDPQVYSLIEQIARVGQQPWVVWESPAARSTLNADQQVLVAYVERRLGSPTRRYFDAGIRPDQLKRDVMELLKPSARIISPACKKRRVALIYDSQNREERANAGDVQSRWKAEFDFDLPSGGMARPTKHADGFLLIWGSAEESWASDQFERLIPWPGRKGLCVFDPEKREIVQDISRNSSGEWYVSEHYGHFVAERLEPFFADLRQSNSAVGAA